MRSTRVIAAAATLVLAGLVAGAATLAATTSAPSVVKHLAVGPGPLRTATATVRFADSSGITVDATCRFDFVHGTADVSASDSLSIITVTLGGRLIGNDLYLEVASLASLLGAPWLTTRLPAASGALRALGAELRHPHLGRFAAHRLTTTRTTTSTTTTFSFDEVRLPSTAGLPIELPKRGRLEVSVTTGTEGQVLSLDARLTSPDGGSNRLDLTIDDYDVAVSIGAPPSGSVVPFTRTRARQLLGSNFPASFRLLERLGAKVRG